jgi:hypothetical protein
MSALSGHRHAHILFQEVVDLKAAQSASGHRATAEKCVAILEVHRQECLRRDDIAEATDIEEIQDEIRALPEAPQAEKPAIPEGWKLVPIRATLPMHNAAAFSEEYRPAAVELDDNGRLKVWSRCPDWSKVYDIMLAAAPSPDGNSREGGGNG